MNKANQTLAAETIFDGLKKYIIGKIEEKNFGRDVMWKMNIVLGAYEYHISLTKYAMVSKISISAKNMHILAMQSSSGGANASYVVFPFDFQRETFPSYAFDSMFGFVNDLLPAGQKMIYPMHAVTKTVAA